MDIRPEQETLETQVETRLRASAPTLPPELRERVLRRCQEQPRNKTAFAWFGRQRLAGALAGFACLCWIASGRLDAQSQAMIAGTGGWQTGNTLAIRVKTRTPLESDSQNFGIALRWRMRQLALLLHDKHSG